MTVAETESQEKRLVEVARLFYEEQSSKSDIAGSLQISITHVNRLLKEAQRRGIVDVVIRAPRFEDLEAGLARVFGLRDVRVVPHMDSADALRRELAEAAAECLQPRLTKGTKIGLASGSTILEMVSRLKDQPSDINIYPLNVLANGDTEVKSLSANTITTVLWFKCRPDAKAYRLELSFPGGSISELRRTAGAALAQPETERLRREIRDLDIYVLGVSGLRAESQMVSASTEMGADFAALALKGVVGDVAFNAINAEGELVQTELEASLFHVNLETLKRLSKKKDRSVLLIGGGAEKFDAIRAALKGRVFNGVVTDNETAQRLLSELGCTQGQESRHV